MAYNPNANIVISGKTFTDVPSVQFKTPYGAIVNFAHVGGSIRFSPTLEEQTNNVENFSNAIIDPITSTLLNQLDSDFVAENIKKGVDLFGLLGTLEAGGSNATEPYIEENYGSDLRLTAAVLHGHSIIRNYAFYDCTSLTSVTIPDSVISIGEAAFQNCTSLTSVTIPNGVTRIRNYTFYDCTGLTSVTIPDSITRIGGSSFQNCTSLTSVTIPGSVMKIESSAFAFCGGLTSVTFKGTPSSINYNVFSNCSALNTINVPWAEGTVSDAPWGATNATINYNYTGE